MKKPISAEISAQIVNMTPTEAKVFRATCHFERQRAINKNNVDRLANEMAHGWFIEGTPIYMAVMPDEQMYILNGNHTLEAVVQSGVTIPLTIIYRRVENLEHAAQLYANMDIQQVRSWRNALQALEGDNATAFDAKVIAALGIIISKFSNNTSVGDKSRTARFELFEHYGSAAQRLENSIRGGTTKHKQYISRAPVLAVALITTKAQPTAADDFWSAIAVDDGLKVGDPRKALLRYLSNYGITTGSSNQRLSQAKAAALAWNAYYENRTLETVKPGQAKDVTILGTPWHKGPPSDEVLTKKYKPIIEVQSTKMDTETGVDAATGKPVAFKLKRVRAAPAKDVVITGS